MMKVKIVEAGKALHPDEIVVAVKTLTGTENLVVDRHSIKDNSIGIGYPIRTDGNNYLIELPNESLSGSWRVWVSSDQTTIEPQKISA